MLTSILRKAAGFALVGFLFWPTPVSPSPEEGRDLTARAAPAPPTGRRGVSTVDPIRHGAIRREAHGARRGPIVLSNGIRIDGGSAKAPRAGEGRYRVVRFDGPIRRSWREALRLGGAEPIGYLPDDALIVRVPAAAAPLDDLPGVAWSVPFDERFKRSASLSTAPKNGGEAEVVALLFPGVRGKRVAARLADGGLTVVEATDDILLLRADAEGIDALAAAEEVRWIEPHLPARFFNNECQWVVQSDLTGQRSIWSHGLRGEGVLLSLCDSGILPTHDMFRDDAMPISDFGDFANHRKVTAYLRASDSPFILFGDDAGASYHGTHTACTVAGNDTTYGTSGKDGIAPEAKLFFVDGGGTTNEVYLPVDLDDLYRPVYQGNGAGAPRIMSNSWGTLAGGAYDYRCEQTDRFVWDHKDFLLVFSNGNVGIGNSVASPAAAKNCIGAGGTENGSSADQIYVSSSRGPTDDGRFKPTLCTPARLSSASGVGSGDYQTLDGTSMAAPSIAASAGLVRQYFVEGRYPSGVEGGSPSIDPSAALLRAVLVSAGEEDVEGYTIPSNDIGWGRLRLEDVLFFPGDSRRLAAVDHVEGLQTGETMVFEVTVASSSKPLEATLVWTDYPSTPAASRNLVNDLDLTLIGGGETYLGNVINGGESFTGGTRDSINVEEGVLVRAPATGTWIIEVAAVSVPFGPQPFALVLTGDLDPTVASAALDRTSYGGADTITVTVEDGDLASPPTVLLYSDTESASPESLLLGGDSGLYRGSMATTTALPVSGDGLLSVSHGDSIRIEYVDASESAVRSAGAVVTLVGPVLYPIESSEADDDRATVRWSTDVPSDSRVYVGFASGAWVDTIVRPELVVDHEVELPGLLPDTTYVIAVSSADFRGNRTFDGGGGEPYRVTTGPPADVLVVIGDLTFRKEQSYRYAFERFGWRGRLAGAEAVTVGDRESGLRSHPVVWWQAGWEQYPPFDEAARETIDRYLGGGGKLGVVSHDVAWAFGDPTSGFWSAEAEGWLADRLRIAWTGEPTYWNIVFGRAGDFISNSYTAGIGYEPLWSGGAGDEIGAAPGAAATIDTVWKDNYFQPIGIRWVDNAVSGSPDSAVWGGSRSRGVTYCFEWSELNDAVEDDYHRARVLDRSLRWLIGRDHPDVALTTFAAGGTITGAPASIEWSETIDGGVGVGSRRIEWSGDGGGSWNRIDGNAGPSPYSWDLAGVPNGTAVRVRVTVFDGGDPHLTGRDASDGDITIALPGNDSRGPRVIAGSASVSPNPAVVPGTIVVDAILSDSTRGGSSVTGAEWSLGPAAGGSGTAFAGGFGGTMAAVTCTIDAALLAPPIDTVWIRGIDGAGVWGEAYPLGVVLRGDFTSVANDDDAPKRFHLYGNAPNPFNPTTTIRFDLPDRAKTRVAVFDIRGRRVRDLVDGDLPAGRHAVLWDGTGEGGRDVASGVYLLRVEAAEQRAVRKMVLLR